MPNKLTIVLSGRKQSGKTSTCNYILAKYLNKKPQVLGSSFRFFISPTGDLIKRSYKIVDSLIDSSVYEDRLATDADMNPINKMWAKRYNFADPLKNFCVDVLNVPYEQCWGTDAQKNTTVPHILWDNFPTECRPVKQVWHDSQFQEFSGPVKDGWYEDVPAKGPMTGREILQVFGTNICRKIYGDCWARGTYNSIKKDGFELAVVTDGRFPNEIDLGAEVNAKTVRLLRSVYADDHPSEKALDNYPILKYSHVVDNSHMTLDEQCRHMDPIIDKWFEEAGI